MDFSRLTAAGARPKNIWGLGRTSTLRLSEIIKTACDELSCRRGPFQKMNSSRRRAVSSMNPGIINIQTPLKWHKETAFVQMLALVELLHRV
jgi:hypothetical protein